MHVHDVHKLTEIELMQLGYGKIYEENHNVSFLLTS